MGYRLSRKQLEELNTKLANRDIEVLNTVEKCRYIASGQIRRLHFTRHSSQNAATRACNRALEKLGGYALIEALPRRVGGHGAGSGLHIFLLTEAGSRLLHLRSDGHTPRKRFFLPSVNFLTHTLAVAEAYVQCSEICRRNGLSLKTAELEPECWRSYTGEDGKPATLKPDIYVVTVNGKYEDLWFLEIDLGTESPAVVLEKCRRYTYCCLHRGRQKTADPFPLVVWIVKSPERRASLTRQIEGCPDLAVKGLFRVILPDELETLLHSGAEASGGKGGGC